MREKAVEFAKSLGYPHFKAIDGWLDKFKNREHLTQKSIYTECVDAPQEIFDS